MLSLLQLCINSEVMNGAHLPGVGIKPILMTHQETSYFLLAYLYDHSRVFLLDINVPLELFGLVVQNITFSCLYH